MKTIKIIGLFLYQKVIEIGQIIVFKQNWGTPATVVILVRIIVYLAVLAPIYYYIGVVTCYILNGKIKFEGEPWLAGIVGIALLGLVSFCVAILWEFYLLNLILDFGNWFSKNWIEAKSKMEGKK